MEVIPVVDLMDGVVVHAKRGQRSSYQPIQSVLCKESDPIAVIASLFSLFCFQSIYIADLNAIMKTGDNRAIIRRILQEFPGIRFWCDCGFPTIESRMSERNYLSVIGSEYIDEGSIPRLMQLSDNFVLSLDFFADRMLGCVKLSQDPSLWPEKVIIMSLSHVGSGEGPDIKRLNYYRSRWPETVFIAAGGIGGVRDLASLHSIGIETVLSASALHSGRLTVDALRAFKKTGIPAMPG